MTLIVFQNYMNKINHEIALLVKILTWPTIYTAGHSAFWRLKIEGEDSFVYLLYFYRKIWGISLHHTYSLNTKVKYDFCHYHNYCNSFNSF